MVRVVVQSDGGLAQEIQARTHRFAADEPLASGGSDSGPTPYELLLGALGACTAITVHLYAQRKGWPLDRVEVNLDLENVHVHDAALCEDSDDCVIGHITKHVSFFGPLDSEQRERLAVIASRCPVHRTLEGKIRIEQHMAPPAQYQEGARG